MIETRTLLGADPKHPPRLEPDRTGPRERARLTCHDRVDVCRGLFAIMVVLAHALETTWSLHPRDYERLSPLLQSILGYRIGSGIYWVMGFFVISGYCIHLSVGRLMEAPRFPFRYYLAARLTRILPLYYVALLFTVAVEWLVAGHRMPNWMNGVRPSVLVSQLLVVQNFTQTYGSFAPSWSITNELFYYLLYGVLAYAAGRRGDLPAKVGLGLCAVAAGMSLAAIHWGRKTGFLLSTGMLFGLGLNWFLGAWVAARADWLVKSRRARDLARTWPIVLVSAILLRFVDGVPIQAVELACGVAFALMLVGFLSLDFAAGVPAGGISGSGSGVARALGLSSYPLYLFHGPVLMLVGSTIARVGVPADWRLTLALMLTACTLTGIVLGHVAERPILAWRAGVLRRLRDARPARAPGGSSPHSSMRLGPEATRWGKIGA